MPPARRAQSRRVQPTNRREHSASRPEAAGHTIETTMPPHETSPVQTGAVPAPGDAIIASTGDTGTFETTGVPPADGEVKSEVTNPDSDGDNSPSSNSDNPQGTTEDANPGIQREEGEPRGFIVDVGSRANRLPVRRVEGNDTMVQAREDIFVRRQAIGSKRHIYTLFMVAGTQFPKSQLDTIIQ